MIILDSSFIIAHKVEEDYHHLKAINLMGEIAKGRYGDAVISDYIFDEVLTVVFAKTKQLSKAVEIGKILLHGMILKTESKTFNDAWEFFQKQKNMQVRFSFTDCTILELMRENNIENIATFDEDFKKIKDLNVVS